VGSHDLAPRAHPPAGVGHLPPAPGATPAERPVRPAPADQLALFAPAPPHPVVERLKALDVNAMTPLQAIALLGQLADEARGR
jgi:hypothetical protein